MKLPRIDSNDLVRVLKKLGFNQVRQSGSHKLFRNPEGKRVTVPYHSKKTLHPKLLKGILIDLNLSVDEFVKLLKG